MSIPVPPLVHANPDLSPIEFTAVIVCLLVALAFVSIMADLIALWIEDVSDDAPARSGQDGDAP